MSDQYCFFEFESEKLTIKKPVRLIELFAGYGSQALALKYLGVPFEHWHISEWAIKSIQAYKDMHFDDDTDYSVGREYNEILDWLDGRVSQNYNDPLDRMTLERYGEAACRKIYSNMICERNVGSVVLAKAEDLEIKDTKDYTYVLTYSFPCQDLSTAGNQAGMVKGSGTRSGMLWEVERILSECEELPQILLMENVPQVITASGFTEWIAFLESIGYTSNYKVLNATDYGVPQNRERCFMVSWLGDYWFEFPQPFDLALTAKDVCESAVDESYYIPDERAKELIGNAVAPQRERERD